MKKRLSSLAARWRVSRDLRRTSRRQRVRDPVADAAQGGDGILSQNRSCEPGLRTKRPL